MTPFLSREPATDPQSFIGRSAILRWMLQRLLGPSPQNINLVGEPRIGKTSVLHHLIQRGQQTAPSPTLFLLLAPAEWITQDASTFWQSLHRQLLRQTEQTDTLSPPDADPHTTFLALLDTLENILVQRTWDRILIVIDDFDLLAPHLTPDDLNWLRSLTQRATLLNHVAFVIASTRALPQLTPDIQDVSPFYNIFMQRWLGLLTHNEAETLVQTALEASSHAPSETIQTFCLAEAGRHPALLRILLEYVLSHDGEGHQLDWDAIRADFRYDDQVQWLFRTLFQRRTPEEQQALLALARGETAHDRIILAHLAHHLGLVEATDQGFRLFSDAFRDWLRQHATAQTPPIPKTHTSDQIPLLTYHPDQGQVTLGQGEPIQLTRVENRLMNYLVSCAGKICSQEAILAHVWGPDRNKAVVEKTINRLRSKIEPDPSRPRYIVSVWGQGYILKHAKPTTP